jgi:hypothetical protein
MIVQHDVRRCDTGCCFFIASRAVSLPEYNSAIGNDPLVPKPVPGQTTIPCMKTAQNRTRAKRIGFYVGRAIVDLAPTGDYYVYDSETHDFIRNATDEDLQKWGIKWTLKATED